jgi:hypothetical protein
MMPADGTLAARSRRDDLGMCRFKGPLRKI